MRHFLNNEYRSYIIRAEKTRQTVNTFIYQLLDAVAYMHIMSIVHKDIKPENILLTSQTNESQSLSYVLKIIDFGIAETLHSGEHLQQIGTISYLSPECLQGYGNEKGDVWACGCILWELLVLGKDSFFPYSPDRTTNHEDVLAYIRGLEYYSRLREGTDNAEAVFPPLAELLVELLKLEWDRRPNASEAFKFCRHNFFPNGSKQER